MTLSFRRATLAVILSSVATAKPEAQCQELRLALSVAADKATYRLNEVISFDVKLTNVGKRAVFLYEKIDYANMFGGYTICAYDDSGDAILPPDGRVIEDTLLPDIKENQLVKIMPGYFYGIVVKASVEEFLFIRKPGLYDVVVSYRSPVPRDLQRNNPNIWRMGSSRLTARTTVTIVP